MEKFWNEWIESDMIEQEEKIIILVNKLESSFKEFDNLKGNFSEDKILRQKASFLNNYFRDLYEIIELRNNFI